MKKLAPFLLNPSANTVNIVKKRHWAGDKSCTAAMTRTWTAWEQPAPRPKQFGHEGKVRHQVKDSLSCKLNAKETGGFTDTLQAARVRDSDIL